MDKGFQKKTFKAYYIQLTELRKFYKGVGI